MTVKSQLSQFQDLPDELRHWSKDLLNDVLFMCAFNDKLKNGGICEKHILEMSEEDYEAYKILLKTLFNDSRKFDDT